MYSVYPLQLPNAKYLSDLFEEISREKKEGYLYAVVCGTDFQFFYLKPNKAVKEVIGNMRKIVDDPGIYIEIVVRADGTTLICTRYSYIIGSRWLTVVPTSNIRHVLNVNLNCWSRSIPCKFCIKRFRDISLLSFGT